MRTSLRANFRNQNLYPINITGNKIELNNAPQKTIYERVQAKVKEQSAKNQKLRKPQKLKIKWSDLPIEVLRMCIAEGIYKPKLKSSK
jgi:hypothetical protein